VIYSIEHSTVRWHRRNHQLYVTLVPHPYQDTFATIHQLPSHTNNGLSVYSVSSSVPLLSQTVPFGIRNLVWYPSSSTSALSRTFSLVGITHTFGVVLLGHDISTAYEANSSTKTLQKGHAVPKRSLFEEMFGVPALTDIPHNTVPAAIDTTLPWKSSETARVFDAPAYLMPPMESIFESLINGFLKLRTKEDVDEEHQNVVQDADVDIPAEAVDTEEATFIEMAKVSNDVILDAFIPFFKDIAGE
jgi:NET1-associated nuclear protein 1 (U3 small nucleolar RNA-associated protein 17)